MIFKKSKPSVSSNTSGDYSPGIVYGNYTVNIITNEILEKGSADRIDLETGLDSLLFGKDKSLLGPFKTVYDLANSLDIKDKILTTWGQVSNFNHPTPAEILKIGEKLLPLVTTSNSWELRRLSSIIVGQALSELGINKITRQAVGRLADIASETHNGKIFLASALSRETEIAFGFNSELEQLINAEHPQVCWQIFKAYESLPSLTQGNQQLDSILSNSGDTWRRHRLLISFLLQLSSTNKTNLSAPQKKLLYELVIQEQKTFGDSFLIILDKWQRSSFGLSLFPTTYSSSINLPENDSLYQFTCNIKNKNTPFIPTRYQEITYLSSIYDLLCLNFELPDNRNKLSGRGHYGIVASWIIHLVKAVDGSMVEDCINELITCKDEGVRWAIANIINSIEKLDVSIKLKIIMQLLNDENIWVLRETVDSICDTNKPYNKETLFSIADHIVNKICDLEKETLAGRDEVLRPFMKMVSRFPEVSERFSLVPVNR